MLFRLSYLRYFVRAAPTITREFSSQARNLEVISDSFHSCTSIPSASFLPLKRILHLSPHIYCLASDRDSSPHHPWNRSSCLQDHLLKHLSAMSMVVSKTRIPSHSSVVKALGDSPLTLTRFLTMAYEFLQHLSYICFFGTHY